MKAGRELDAKVAERVMRWSIDPGLSCETAFLYPPEWDDELGAWPSTCGRQQEGSRDLVPHYSTDLADAMKMLDSFEYYRITKHNFRFQVTIVINSGAVYQADADTFGEAACLAALKAVGYE